jgi:hypothetical protein
MLNDFLRDRKIPDAQAIPKRLYIFPDGTTVNEKETKAGCIHRQYERFNKEKRYTGSFDNSEVFGNEEQMHYDIFMSKDYDISSGAFEGACKYLVSKRLKQFEMIWSRSGYSATLAMRIIWLNKEWENYGRKNLLAA